MLNTNKQTLKNLMGIIISLIGDVHPSLGKLIDEMHKSLHIFSCSLLSLCRPLSNESPTLSNLPIHNALYGLFLFPCQLYSQLPRSPPPSLIQLRIKLVSQIQSVYLFFNQVGFVYSSIVYLAALTMHMWPRWWFISLLCRAVGWMISFVCLSEV